MPALHPQLTVLAVFSFTYALFHHPSPPPDFPTTARFSLFKFNVFTIPGSYIFIRDLHPQITGMCPVSPMVGNGVLWRVAFKGLLKPHPGGFAPLTVVHFPLVWFQSRPMRSRQTDRVLY